MFDLRKNIIPTRVFIEALEIPPHQFYKKNKSGTFSGDERSTIFNVINNYPPIYPNISILDHYMRINNIDITELVTRLNVQKSFFYSFKAIPLSDEPQNDIIAMLQTGEPLNLNKLVDPLANERVKRVLKREGINLLYFRDEYMKDHAEVRRYVKTYSSLFLNIEYTEEIQKDMINYIAKKIKTI